MYKIRKKTKWIIFGCLVLSLIGPLRGEESDWGACEAAFFLCLQDPLWTAAPTEGLIYCAIGYAFCKKYIDSVRDY